jgi:hypothetical protein
MDLFISFCSQGQHFDIFMDNVDMIYMNIMKLSRNTRQIKAG